MAIRTRRLAAAAGMMMAVVATGGVLTATPASAAQGTLRINAATYQNPYGCYNIDSARTYIVNDTDKSVYVFGGLDCQADLEDIIVPGSWRDEYFLGRSVLVP